MSTKPFTIRKARIADIPTITELGMELNRQHQGYDPALYSTTSRAAQMFKDHYRKCIYAPNRAVLAAIVGDQLVAFAVASIRKRPPIYRMKHIGHLDEVFVLKPWRRQGIATAFMDEFRDWFRQKKMTMVTLIVDEDNEVGMKAWDALGYHPYLSFRKYRVR